MLSIQLNKLQFEGTHGVYPEEKLTGGRFEADVIVQFEPRSIPIRYMDETIDYTRIYEIVKSVLDEPAELLETLVTESVHRLLSAYGSAEYVSVTIRKLNAPIEGFRGEVGAQFEWKRHSGNNSRR